MKNKIIEAVLKINPTAEVSVSGDDINSMVTALRKKINRG